MAAQVHHFLSPQRPPSLSSITSLYSSSSTNGSRTSMIVCSTSIFRAISVSSSPVRSHTPPRPLIHPQVSASQFRLFCNPIHSGMVELGGHKRANAIFWIILLNLAIYVADHIFLIRDIKTLYLFHNRPAWYQFVTAAFCHENWNHLSINLFFLYIFGKLVEEDMGSFALWLSYILTGASANLVLWLVIAKNAVSVGASGAVFGLFAISVLLKISRDWRNFLEVLILGQLIVAKVMEATQTSTHFPNGLNRTYTLQNVSRIPMGGELLVWLVSISHLFGAMVGVLLVWLVIRVPTDPSKKGFSEKSNKQR